MARVHVHIIRSSLMIAVMAETRLPSRAIRTMMRGIGVKLYFLISTKSDTLLETLVALGLSR